MFAGIQNPVNNAQTGGLYVDAYSATVGVLFVSDQTLPSNIYGGVFNINAATGVMTAVKAQFIGQASSNMRKGMRYDTCFDGINASPYYFRKIANGSWLGFVVNDADGTRVGDNSAAGYLLPVTFDGTNFNVARKIVPTVSRVLDVVQNATLTTTGLIAASSESYVLSNGISFDAGDISPINDDPLSGVTLGVGFPTLVGTKYAVIAGSSNKPIDSTADKRQALSIQIVEYANAA